MRIFFAPTPTRSRYLYPLLIALLLAWLLALWSSWSLPLFDEDEGEYGEVALEMARSGDFLTPTLNAQPFFEKPILAFWLQAPLLAWFGVHPGVFRLPSLVACTLWFAALARFGVRHCSNSTGVGAAFLAATTAGVTISAQAAGMEGLLCWLMALTCFDIYEYWLSDRAAPRRRVFLWMGVGFLAKGPIAWVIPFVASGLFFWQERQLRRWWQACTDPWGWLVMLGLVFPWYGAQYLRMGPSFLDYFLIRENWGRLSGTLQGHGGNFAYYIPVLFVVILPYSTLLLGTLAQAGRRLVGTRQLAPTPLERWLWIWFLTVFGVFTLASTKLPHYLLIGLTPLFLLMAASLPRRRLRWPDLIPAGALATLTLALPALVERLSQESSNLVVHEILGRGTLVFDSTWWGITTGLLLLLALAWWVAGKAVAGLREGSGPWVMLGIATQALITLVWLPSAAALQQQPVLAAARQAAQLGQSVVADNRLPSFAIYSGRPTLNRPPHSGDLVFLRADLVKSLPPHTILYAGGGVRLVQIQ